MIRLHLKPSSFHLQSDTGILAFGEDVALSIPREHARAALEMKLAGQAIELVLLAAGEPLAIADAIAPDTQKRIDTAQASLIEKDSLLAEKTAEIERLGAVARGLLVEIERGIGLYSKLDDQRAALAKRVERLENEAAACAMAKGDAPIEDPLDACMDGCILDVPHDICQTGPHAIDTPDAAAGQVLVEVVPPASGPATVPDPVAAAPIVIPAEDDLPHVAPAPARIERSSFLKRAPCASLGCDKLTLRRVPVQSGKAPGEPDLLATFRGKPLCFGCEIDLGAIAPEVQRCSGTNKAAGVPCAAEGKVQRSGKWFCGRCDPEKAPRTAKPNLTLAPAPIEVAGG